MDNGNSENNGNNGNTGLVQLRIVGLSYSQIQTGAYALILGEVNGPYRIPVVIGVAEAQSIAIRLENIEPPRPMTHDLFIAFTKAFGMRLQSAFIYKFEDGIFYSELTFTDGERTVSLDSRTSDAIGIVLRTNAPIFTTREVLAETGFILEETAQAACSDDDERTDISRDELNDKIRNLEEKLAICISEEQYEEAAELTTRLNALKQRLDQLDNDTP